MATLGLSGKTGSAVATGGTGTIGSEITQWEASVELELLDGTSFASGGWEESIAGLQSASGTLTGIGSMPVTGSVTSLTLQTSTTAGSLEITGEAFISAGSTSTPVDGRVEYSGTFKFSGAVTIGTVSS